jgi:SAM-dependent methyltransferase
MKCRACNSTNLKLFLDLGKIPLVDKFKTKNELSKKEKFFPLNVCICSSCKLVQLGYILPPKTMFNSKYAYESSTTQLRTKVYFDMAKVLCKRFKLKPDSLVVDVGSNIGLLLKGFKKQKMKVLGIDPSSNIAKMAIDGGIDTIIDFFNPKIASKILKKYGYASIITATNVFAHVDDLNSFMKSCKILLDDNGIFVFQSPYLYHLIKNNEYDTIYHEHVSYLSITPLVSFFNKFDLEIFDIDENIIDGGSIRCYIGKKNLRPISTKIQKYVNLEKKSGIHTMKRLKKFSSEVKSQKRQLKTLLKKLKQDKKRIVAVSAPAKGTVLLNYCDIDEKILDFATEKSSIKIGKYMPGNKIPVVHDNFLDNDFPDYALLLAWNFADEIMNNLKNFKKNGGKFIIPIPHPKIV